MLEDSITAIVVHYCTPQAITRAIASTRKFYPLLKIIIVDGSPAKSKGWQTCESFASDLIKVAHPGHNIGHGKGMNLGVSMVDTAYFLTFDSDIEMLKPPLQEMLETFNTDIEVYGCGNIQTVDERGKNAVNGTIKYLHPHFALINREQFNKYGPYLHHGAPCIRSMIEIGRTGKDLLVDFPVRDYVFHEKGVTSKLVPKFWNEGYWDKV